MRQAIALTLLLFLLLPVFATATGTTPRVALCCRRGGVHQCMGGMVDAASAGIRTALVRATCNYLPKISQTAPSGKWPDLAVNVRASMPLRSAESVRQVEAGYRISGVRTRQKRGPPQDIS